MKGCEALLFFLFMALGSSLATRLPFQSFKAPAETVTNYDVVSPEVIFRSEIKPHPKELKVVIPAESASFTLRLELNQGLLPSHFTSRYYDEDGSEIVERGHVNCFYHGEVEGHPEWRAVMSTCNGLQGSFGDRGNKTQYYHLEPMSYTDTSLEQPHALYLDSEYNDFRGTCGSGGRTHNAVPNIDTGVVRERLRRQTSGTLIVEWVVVNDFRQYDTFNRNISATILRSLDVANEVDMLYRALNTPGMTVRVVLIEVITWTTGDQISVVSNPNTLLQNFRDYRPQIQTLHDSTMLVTGIDLDGNIVGIAFPGTMCDDRSSVGLTQDGGASLTSVSSTAAHEMGHIFSMQHDDRPECNCQDPSGNCIMATVSGFPSPTLWSDCSRRNLQSGLTSGLGSCLTNEPTMTVGGPVCGNGIREGDEMCDCGNLQECTDPCCNATSCELIEGALCGQGLCCQDNCQFVSYGTTCREASNECDITEYCSGDSSDCPTDFHIQDGRSCSNSESFCFSGDCQSHGDQCRLYFGQDSGMGGETCYGLNTRGDQLGNCGYTTSDFIACDSSDVFCGQLQCIPGTFDRSIFPFVRVFTVGDDCSSFTTQPESDLMSPGLVSAGSRCGDGMLCFQQQCVSMSTFIVPCATTNGTECSGNGQCNNRNECSCDVGYEGNACQTQVGSGSSLPCATTNGTECSGNGQCNNRNECSCDVGYEGNACQTQVGSGSSLPCATTNGTECSGNGQCNNRNECSCDVGYEGNACQTQVGSGSSLPCATTNGTECSGNGQCNNRNECSCDVGYEGNACQTQVGSGSSLPCATTNGTECSGNGQCNNRNECSCDVGYEGIACQIQIGSGSSSSNAGAIAGGVIGGLLGLVLIGVIVGVVVFFIVKHNSSRSYSSTKRTTTPRTTAPRTTAPRATPVVTSRGGQQPLTNAQANLLNQPEPVATVVSISGRPNPSVSYKPHSYKPNPSHAPQAASRKPPSRSTAAPKAHPLRPPPPNPAGSPARPPPPKPRPPLPSGKPPPQPPRSEGPRAPPVPSRMHVQWPPPLSS